VSPAQRHVPPAARRQRGLSLVELMVGIAIGLFVVAGAATVVATQLSDNRRLLIETQLQQDLRASTDIITRELRRAGYTTQAQQGVWYAGTPQVQRNTFATVTPDAGVDSATGFSYRRGPGAEGPYGFRLNDGKIQTRLAASGWQDLTDAAVLRVTNFSVEAQNGPAVQLPCPSLCADGTQDCWPTLTVREMVVDISAVAVSDPTVQRSVRSAVRLRNDWVRFNDPLNPEQICPPS
jgi:prepilin-type N-terminal cleavage/methylation domain-containing protein